MFLKRNGHITVDGRKFNMPIDKFGRHMLTSRIAPYINQGRQSPILTSTATPPLYLCQPVLFSSRCVIQLRASRSSIITSRNLYLLENGGSQYISLISGKIESIRISKDSKLIINNKTTLEIKDTKDTLIAKGDALSFLAPAVGPKTVLIEIVLLCPLEKDE